MAGGDYVLWGFLYVASPRPWQPFLGALNQYSIWAAQCCMRAFPHTVSPRLGIMAYLTGVWCRRYFTTLTEGAILELS